MSLFRGTYARARGLLSACASVFYPQVCPMCGRYIGDGRWICDVCLDSLPRTEEGELRGNITEFPFEAIPRFERGAAFLFYEQDHPVRQMIHTMKYQEQPMLGYYLGRQAAMEMQYTDFFDEIDIIMPIPLHPKRLRERGYNQSEYIAKGISDITGIAVDTTHVTRKRNTPQQALQTQRGRQTNVSDAFAVNHPEQMYRKHILVVDDLITTGETMRSCLDAMKPFRGAKYSVFALCKAR